MYTNPFCIKVCVVKLLTLSRFWEVVPFFLFAVKHYGDAITSWHLNDANTELMSVYQAIQHSPHEFIANCSVLADKMLQLPSKEERKKLYYDLRQQYWDEPNPALLYALMKFCFNGVWQTCKASQGKFGTPAGLLNQKHVSSVVNHDNIMGWHYALQNVTLTATDFRDVCSLHADNPNSFLFLDPPYRDSSTYSAEFSEKDQLDVLHCGKQHAGSVMLANKDIGDGFFDHMRMFDTYTFPSSHTAGIAKNGKKKDVTELLLVKS